MDLLTELTEELREEADAQEDDGQPDLDSAFTADLLRRTVKEIERLTKLEAENKTLRPMTRIEEIQRLRDAIDGKNGWAAEYERLRVELKAKTEEVERLKAFCDADYWHADLQAYRQAPGGEGPHAATWKDKPHRLIYDLCGHVHRLRKWQQTPEGPNCSGLEQINRIVAGLIREYGDQGKVLNLSRETAIGVPLGQQIQWGCTGRSADYIVICEVATEPSNPEATEDE
jgi:hypothetical protein